MKSTGYFAGANGQKGFVSYFEGVLERAKSVYILKGGCGCGKSALMKRIAAEAESRGERVERIYCASDPKSLDGVILPSHSVAIADGTPPHEISPRLPGAADVIINMGELWDGALLRSKRGEIKALTEKKERAIRHAYRLMAATDSLYKEKSAILEKAVLWGKMRAAAVRTVKRAAPQGDEFSAEIRLRSAFCSEGEVSVTDYGESRCVAVKDCCGIAPLFLEQLLAAAYDRGLSVTVSPDALSPDKMNALLINDTGLLFCLQSPCGEKPINMDRFLDKTALSKEKGKLRFINRVTKAILEEARLSMAESRLAHSALEAIYTPAMDFDRVNRLTDRLIEEIFA